MAGIRRPEPWVVVALLAIAIAMHYPNEFLPFAGVGDQGSVLGLERHAIERVFLLLPIAYVGLMFGFRAGLVASLLALAIMLPRDLSISEHRADALVETGAVIVTGNLVNLWFEDQRGQRRRREELLSRLRGAHEQLHSQFEVIRTRETELAAVNAISSIVSQSLDLEDILNRAADKLMEVAHLEITLIFLIDEKGEFALETYRGVPQEFAANLNRTNVGAGINASVVLTGEPQTLEGVSHDPALKDVLAIQDELQAWLIVALKSKGKVLGTLWVTRGGAVPLTRQEVDLMCAGGNVIGIAIENCRLYREERLMAERVRASERNYRNLFEGAEEAIWVENLDGEIIMANKACARLTGHPPEELIGINIGELLSGETVPRRKDVRDRLLRGEALVRPYEQRLTRKDGSEAILRLSMGLVSRDGQSETIQVIARDVTEERRMEENLRFYLHRITQAQEEERKRIARELHDDTAQELVALSRQLDSFISAPQKLPKQHLKFLEGIRTGVDGLLESVRRFSQDLRPSVIDDLGLLPALEWLVSDLQQQFGIHIGMAVLGENRRLSPDVELVLFRIAQEALRNACRHAQASQAWVTAEFGDGKTTVCIRDNGKGFEVPGNVAELAQSGKLGLAGMAERARLVGGKLTLESKPGEGTTVTIEVGT